MNRLTIAIAAATLLAAPALAGTYSAKPAAPPAAKRIVGRDIVWACGQNGCQGSTGASRPILLCQDLAKRAGQIGSFHVDGRALDAKALAKCNAVARTGTVAALAKAD